MTGTLIGGVYLVVTLDVRRIVCDRICNPKVNQLELALDQDKIGRLQIRMDDFFFVNNMHSLQHLAQA